MNKTYGTSYQGRKHFNLFLLIGALFGAAIGFLVGEVVLYTLTEVLPAVVLVGIYFAQLTFFVFLAILLCEKRDPRLNSRIWTTDHWKDSLKRLPLMTILLFFVIGAILQFFYGLTTKKTQLQRIDDYIICIDNSGSMSGSDGAKERFTAVESFVNTLHEDNQVAVLLFSDDVNTVIPLTKVDDTLRSKVSNSLKGLEPEGGTNIQLVLETAAEIPIEVNRTAMVILLSDGESMVNVKEITEMYSQQNLVLNTIECTAMQLWRNSLLLKLSTSTGGMNYQIPEMNQLAGTLTTILTGSQISRNILDYRYGYDRNNKLFIFLRILFVTIIGVSMIGALAVMLYNLDVLKKMIVLKIITGLIAGFALEFCLFDFWYTPYARLFMVLLLGLFASSFQSSLHSKNENRKNNIARYDGSSW